MDQSASEMFRKLFGNSLDGLHSFIFPGIVLMAVNLEYLLVVVIIVVERFHFAAGSSWLQNSPIFKAITCFELGSVAFITLPKPYSCRSSKDKHYTLKDIY